MDQHLDAFEAYRFVYILAHIFIGIPMIAWAFIVWGVSVYILKKGQPGSFRDHFPFWRYLLPYGR